MAPHAHTHCLTGLCPARRGSLSALVSVVCVGGSLLTSAAVAQPANTDTDNADVHAVVGRAITAPTTALTGGLDLSPQPDRDADIEQLCDDLASRTWSVRDAAHRALEAMLRPYGDEAQGLQRDVARRVLLDALRTRTGTLESQRRVSRLLARDHASQPRAAMGVQFSNRQLDTPVVGIAVKGFDSERVLLPNDIIAAIAGQKVATTNDVRACIFSHLPGETATIDLIRDNKTVRVELTFGQFGNLGNRGAMPTNELVEIAWKIRLERLVGEFDALPIVPEDAVYAPRTTVLTPGISQRNDARINNAEIDTEKDHLFVAGGENLGRALLPIEGMIGTTDRVEQQRQQQGLRRELNNVLTRITQRKQRIIQLNTVLETENFGPAQRVALEKMVIESERFLRTEEERRENLQRRLGIPITP